MTMKKKAAIAEQKSAQALDPVDVRIAVSMMQANYRSAMAEARDSIAWLRGQIADAERAGFDAAFTPGNMGSTVAKIESARWKAKALKEALQALGQQPKSED